MEGIREDRRSTCGDMLNAANNLFITRYIGEVIAVKTLGSEM
jgi:hypothetical protein